MGKLDTSYYIENQGKIVMVGKLLSELQFSKFVLNESALPREFQKIIGEDWKIFPFPPNVRKFR